MGTAFAVLAVSLGMTLSGWWWLSNRIENLQSQRFAREADTCVRVVKRVMEHTAAVLHDAQALIENRPADDALLPPLFDRLRAFSKNPALAGLGALKVSMYGRAISVTNVAFMGYAPGVTRLDDGPLIRNLPGAEDALERTLSTLHPAAFPAPARMHGISGRGHVVLLAVHEGPASMPLAIPAANPETSDVHRHMVVALILQEQPLWDEVRRNLDTEEIHIKWEDHIPASAIHEPFTRVVPLHMMDIAWNALITPGPKFNELDRSNAPLIILGGGSLLSVLLFGMVLVQGRARAIAEDAGARISETIATLEQRITERTVELSLSNQELTRFKAVAETTSDMVGMATVDGRTMFINRAGRELLGFGVDEDISGMHARQVYPEWVNEIFEREGYAHATQHGSWMAQVALLHRDGHEIPVSFVGLVIKGPDGRPAYMACVARDATAQRRLEEQLRQSIVHERELNTMKSNFVNTISHEFRTPLGIILMAAGMLRRFDTRLGPVEREAQLIAIEDAVSRMNDLVEQSLDIGRAEVTEPRMSRIDPLALCRRVVDQVQSASAHRCRIWLKSDGDHPLAKSDETMMHTILTNLLSNAVKYSPEGSQVLLQLTRLNGSGIFTIRDHGRGLPEEEIPKLFTHFYRGSGTEGTPGTGLGLAIVKRCIESLGGGITVRNAEGGGAEFTVSLPIFADSPQLVAEMQVSQ